MPAHQRNASAADHSGHFDHNRNSSDTCEADESLALQAVMKPTTTSSPLDPIMAVTKAEEKSILGS